MYNNVICEIKGNELLKKKKKKKKVGKTMVTK